MPKKGAKAGSSRLAVLPSEYPGKVGGKGLEAPQWGACKAMLEGVYIAKNGSRFIGDIFRDLPDRDIFADYYQTIPEPESLDNIAVELGKQTYPTPEAFFNQLQLVFLNAKHYNEEGSQVYEDAKSLHAQIQHAWKTNHATGVFPKSKVKVEAGTGAEASPAPGGKGRGRPKKTDRASSTTSRPSIPPPATEPPRPTTITLNIGKAQAARPPPAKATPSPAQAATPLPTIPVVPTSSTRAAPLPVPTSSQPGPVATHASTRASAATAEPPRLPPQTPIAQTPRVPVADLSAPGINQYTTPAALVPPPSPSETEKAMRLAAAQADQEFMEKFETELPQWQGPDEISRTSDSSGGIVGNGWFGEGPYDCPSRQGGPSSFPGKIQRVLHAITEYRDPSGLKLSDSLVAVPSRFDRLFIQDFPLVSLDIVRQTQYSSLLKFDFDMARVFERGRRYHSEGSTEYGHVIVLQRLYNALTAAYPMPLPASGVPPPSPTMFASLPAGPGTARPLHEITQDLKAGVAENQVGFGITTFRVGTKDRSFTEEARHKGMAYKTGDYIHLINPDDASRPIVGQIFKTFVPTKGYRSHHVTVCWYYRPEQIVHRASRMFYDHEIFKTSHFCDHPVEDIIERVGCQFYVKAIRGRPPAPEWYPGWPLYICHSRYNDRGWFTVRIKNWASCIPDELRQTGFMDIVQWQRIVEPQMLKSPFLRGIRGPGFFAEPREGGEDEDEDESPARKRGAAEPTRRGGSGALPGPKPYVYTPSSLPNRYPAPVSASQGYPTPGSSTPATYRQSPAQHTTPQRSAGPAAQAPPPGVPVSTNGRTIANMMGGSHVVDQLAVREYLPIEVARLFERDSRNQVLWFSGPPLVPGQVKIPTQPTHSLEYLEYLTKRKAGKDLDEYRTEGEPRGKRYRTDRKPLPAALPLIGDGVSGGEEGDSLWTQGMTEEQVESVLKIIIDSSSP